MLLLGFAGLGYAGSPRALARVYLWARTLTRTIRLGALAVRNMRAMAEWLPWLSWRRPVIEQW
jgi:hypothetical protein